MSIPSLRETMTDGEIAKELKCSRATIQRWIRKLKALGIDVPTGKKGRPKILC